MALRISQINAASKPAVLPKEDESSVEESPVQEDTTEEVAAPAPVQELMGGNVDPMVARYFGPECRCQGCIHFMEAAKGQPSSCEIVAGPIDPQGMCSLYTPDQDTEAEESVEPTSETEA